MNPGRNSGAPTSAGKPTSPHRTPTRSSRWPARLPGSPEAGADGAATAACATAPSTTIGVAAAGNASASAGASPFVSAAPDAAGISLTEELIYRGAAQPLLAGLPGGHWTAVPAAALLFSLVHDHFYRNSRRESAEFLLFALTLGLLYHVTGSLAVVIVVHTVRNMESACLEYRALLESTGDEDEANRALELSVSGKPLETP